VNFLAHSALAYDDPALLAGQFAGDFVRGRDLSAYPPRVATGIRLHRRMDAFTDAHPAVAAARASFDPALRRHAGIVMDVVFDHLLARDWPAPAGRDLATHARWADTALSVHASVLPASLARFADDARRTGLLEGNANVAAIGETLERLSRRSPRMAVLTLAAARGPSFVAPLEAVFATLWPALKAATDERLAALDGEVRGGEAREGASGVAGGEEGNDGRDGRDMTTNGRRRD